MAIPFNIAAYTAPHDLYPAYVSINKVSNDVSITVRSKEISGAFGTKPGEVANVIMTLDQFATLILDAGKYLAEYNPVDPNQEKLPGV